MCLACHVISQSAFNKKESNFGGNNVSFEINFREKKMFKYVQMVLPEKNVFCDEILLVWAAVPLFNSYNNKEFTCKSSLTSFCAESAGKKIGWSTCHELKRVVKAKITQNNSQVSAGGMIEITVKPGQDSIHELIIEKWTHLSLL